MQEKLTSLERSRKFSNFLRPSRPKGRMYFEECIRELGIQDKEQNSLQEVKEMSCKFQKSLIICFSDGFINLYVRNKDTDNIIWFQETENGLYWIKDIKSLIGKW